MKFGPSPSTAVQVPELLTLKEAEDELDRQEQVVEKVKQILTFVTAFEESAAESLSNMLINFSNSNYHGKHPMTHSLNLRWNKSSIKVHLPYRNPLHRTRHNRSETRRRKRRCRIRTFKRTKTTRS